MLNKKNILFTFLLMVLMFQFSYSQNYNTELGENGYSGAKTFGRGKARLRGIVKNEEGDLVKDALVVVIHADGVTKFVSKSNIKGVWSVIGLGTGKFTISVSYKGYQQCVETRSVSQLKLNPKVICILKKKEKPVKDEFRVGFRQISHKVGTSIARNEKVYTLFDYNIPKTYNEGVYIWVVPIPRKISRFSPSKYFCRDLQASELITKKQGTLTRYFSIRTGERMVGEIKIVLMNKKKDKILASYSMRVNYRTHPQWTRKHGASWGSRGR